MIKILHVGPSITKTKGGIATVIHDIIHNSKKDEQIALSHLASHIDGSFIDKLLVLFQGLYTLLTKSSHIDILHIHAASDISFIRKTLFVLMGKALGKKVILHMHGGDFDIYYQKSPALLRYYMRKVLESCDKIIVLSAYWKTFFQRHFPEHQIEVLHNGVEAELFKPYQSVFQNSNKFLFMGRLTREKGIYDLLAAADKLVNGKQRRDLRFYIAGDGEMEKVQDLITTLNLTDNVKLLGWIAGQKKLEWLGKVDTVLLPSYIEGLPMSIIEAMAAGKIVISTNVGGIPDLVNEGENGYMTNPGDVDALCQAILHVEANPEEMAAISANNIEKVNAMYNLPKLHAQLFTLYHTLAGNKYVFEKSNVTYKYPVTQPIE